MRHRKDDKLYVPKVQAQQAGNLDEHRLAYHAAAGNIRTRPLPNAHGRLSQHYHIDDCQRAAYHRSRDLARAVGLKRVTVNRILRTWHIPGVTKFGTEYRIAPRHFDDVVKWFASGRPVRSPFVPRQEVPA